MAVVRVDVDRRELDFRLIQRQPRPKSAGRAVGERRKKVVRGKPAKGSKKKRTGGRSNKKAVGWVERGIRGRRTPQYGSEDPREPRS